jgi:hypothetical protein
MQHNHKTKIKNTLSLHKEKREKLNNKLHECSLGRELDRAK